MNDPDLRFLSLARMCREQWRENPLCRRLWRGIRPWVLVIALVMAMQSGVGAVISTMGGAIAGGGLLAPRFLAVIAGSCFVGTLSLAFWIGAPIWYANWAHRKTWSGNEQMRAAPLPKRERLLAILVPALLAQAVIHLPGLVLTPVAFGLGSANMAPGMPQNVPALGAFVLSSFSVVSMGLVAALMLAPTVILRTLLLDSNTGRQERRNWLTVAWPFVVSVVIGIAWGMLRQGPVIAMMMMVGMRPSATLANTLAWIGISGFQIAGDFAAMALQFIAMRAFWRRDIPVARRALYED